MIYKKTGKEVYKSPRVDMIYENPGVEMKCQNPVVEIISGILRVEILYKNPRDYVLKSRCSDDI